MRKELRKFQSCLTPHSLGEKPLFWIIGTLPYITIAAYAGSVSTLDDPRPAIFAALGLYGVMWGGWFVYRKWWMKDSARLLV